MQLTTVREIYRDREAFLDKEITVGGWVRSIRDSKTFGFIVLHDGTFFETLQIVYHDQMNNFAEISRLNVGASQYGVSENSESSASKNEYISGSIPCAFSGSLCDS